MIPGLSPPAVVREDRAFVLFAETRRLSEDRTLLQGRLDHVTLDLAALLATIRRERLCEDRLGTTFAAWVRETLRDQAGRPRTYDWAKRLTIQFDSVAPWPRLIALLRSGRPDGDAVIRPSWTAAYTASRVAVLEGWLSEERARLTPPGATGPAAEAAYQAARDAVDARICELALDSREALLERHQCAAFAAKASAGGHDRLRMPPTSVDRDVHRAWWRAVRFAFALEAASDASGHQDLSPETASTDQILERVTAAIETLAAAAGVPLPDDSTT
jgi:hypothetical protein